MVQPVRMVQPMIKALTFGSEQTIHRVVNRVFTEATFLKWPWFLLLKQSERFLAQFCGKTKQNVHLDSKQKKGQRKKKMFQAWKLLTKTTRLKIWFGRKSVHNNFQQSNSWFLEVVELDDDDINEVSFSPIFFPFWALILSFQFYFSSSGGSKDCDWS